MEISAVLQFKRRVWTRILYGLAIRLQLYIVQRSLYLKIKAKVKSRYNSLPIMRNKKADLIIGLPVTKADKLQKQYEY